MSRPLKPPTLPALRVTSDSGREQSVLWCPWCEGTHWHGHIVGRGSRAPHCMADRRSPFGRTGYVVEVVGEAASVRAVVPRKPLVRDRRLHIELDEASSSLRRELLNALLAAREDGDCTVERRSMTARLHVFDHRSWRIEELGQRPASGDGLLTLAAQLFGVSPGVAAIRIIEAVTGDILDDVAALAVQAIVDDWAACGAERRPERI